MVDIILKGWYNIPIRKRSERSCVEVEMRKNLADINVMALLREYQKMWQAVKGTVCLLDAIRDGRITLTMDEEKANAWTHTYTPSTILAIIYSDTLKALDRDIPYYTFPIGE